MSGPLKRGRPRDDYPVAEFLATVVAKMDALEITQTSLAKRSGVDRGSLSRVLKELRPASRAARIAISSILDFTPEEKVRFCCIGQDEPKPMLITDYQYPRKPALSEAAALLHQGFYHAASQEFTRVFHAAQHDADLVLQADAAGRAALVYLEMGQFVAARQWADRSIAKCSECIGLPLSEIIREAPRYSPAASPSKSELAARILSDTLHNLAQIFARQMLYFGNRDLVRSARLGVENSLKLDRRLDLAQPVGNDLRCRAVVEAMANWADPQLAFRLIDECKENFTKGGLFEAHWVKTYGIIGLHTDNLARGRKWLMKSDEMLALFPDARGLALERYMLSHAILRTSGDAQQALRYLISAAALHPYGWVVERCRQQARNIDRRGLQAEIDALVAGKGLYSAVHHMTAWIAQGSRHSAEDLLFRNIHLMTAGNFPQIELPNRAEASTRDAGFPQ